MNSITVILLFNEQSFFKIYLFFGCAGPLLLLTDFLHLHWAGFSLEGHRSRVRGLQRLQHEGSAGTAPGLWSTGSAVTGHRLLAPRHLNLPRLGIEPASPALAGGLFTTVTPGKSADSLVSSKRIINLMSPNLLCLWKVSCNISCSLITKYIQLNF